VLVLYDSFCSAQKQLLLVLLGLGRLYYPGWRWLDRLMDEMQVTPPASGFKDSAGQGSTHQRAWGSRLGAQQPLFFKKG
jgi:hypothetical protein